MSFISARISVMSAQRIELTKKHDGSHDHCDSPCFFTVRLVLLNHALLHKGRLVYDLEHAIWRIYWKYAF